MVPSRSVAVGFKFAKRNFFRFLLYPCWNLATIWVYSAAPQLENRLRPVYPGSGVNSHRYQPPIVVHLCETMHPKDKNRQSTCPWFIHGVVSQVQTCLGAKRIIRPSQPGLEGRLTRPLASRWRLTITKRGCNRRWGSSCNHENL